MNRRELAKKSGIGLCGFLLGSKSATKLGSEVVAEPVDWDNLECVVAAPLPVHGYGDTVWLHVYRPLNSNDTTEYFSDISLGGPAKTGRKL